jgi:hypothetical protein
MVKTTGKEAEEFLSDFFVKLSIYDIFFKNREKNEAALLELEITASERLEIIKSLTAGDYYRGPSADACDPASPPNWEFGKRVKGKDVYIKINMGKAGKRVMCISFHIAERKMACPLK